MLTRSRSGARGRLLLGAGPFDSRSTKLGTGCLLYGILVVTVLLCVGFGGKALVSLFDPDYVPYRLARELSPQELRAGVFRGGVTVVGTSPAQVPPICLVTHQHYVSGKNGGWREDWRKVFLERAEVVTAHGRRAPVIADQIQFAPEELVTARYDQVWSAKAGFTSGRYLESCVDSDDKVFVDGCLSEGGALTSCSWNAPLVITTGDGTPQRRIDMVAASTMSRLAWAGFGVWLAMMWLVRVFSAPPLVTELVGRLAKRSRKPAWIAGSLAIGAAFVFVVGLALNGCNAQEGTDAAVSRAGHGFGVVALALFVVTGVLLAQRMIERSAVAAKLKVLPTLPLARASGDLVELAVRVHPQAPPHPGPLSGEPRAWWSLVVREEYRQGKSTSTKLVSTTFSQPGVAVLDESGEGMLELEGAKLDIRSVGQSVKPTSSDAASQRVRPLLDTLPRTAGHMRFIVEESFVEPGESLYVLGHAEQVPGSQARSGYRVAPTTAVVRAKGDASLFVHAGSEGSLLTGINVDRAMNAVLIAALGGMLVLWTGALLWLASR